tara:strand:- start:1631 stop:1810 length:180 start_codon:yes stop_codon:yes gene_type:complete
LIRKNNMSKIKYPYIRKGKYLTNFEVVIDEENIVECYNLATARSIYYDRIKMMKDKKVT